MLDIRVRQLLSKSAGTYFLVTSKPSTNQTIPVNKTRLIFVNTEKGMPNTIYQFAKGDTTAFKAIFGDVQRLKEKKGNFSISTALDALNGGPIAVLNLRSFDDTVDKAGIISLNPNIALESSKTIPYTYLFNTNALWTPKPKNIPANFDGDSLLNFGNIGNNDMSIFVVKATDAEVLTLTNEGEKTLAGTTLAIEDFPALNPEMKVKDSFVTVYVFNNTFDQSTVSTNKYYGQLFDTNGNLLSDGLTSLATITESGYVQKFTGSLLPNLISEKSAAISIDTLINNSFATTGLISFINDELFEQDNKLLLDMFAQNFYDNAGNIKDDVSPYLLSYIVPEALTTTSVTYPLTVDTQNVTPVDHNKIAYGTTKIDSMNFEGSFDQGLRVGDILQGTDNQLVKISGITILDAAATIPNSTKTYQKVKYTTDGPIEYSGVGNSTVTKLIFVTKDASLKAWSLVSYKPRTAQFTDGTASKQKEILDMMNNPGIVKGLKSFKGIRYVVDAFKSFVEPNYKYQFGILMKTLDDSNRFVRAIINEPFLEDMQNSTNPLFKDMPGAGQIFKWSYVPDGGNKQYSSVLMTKFSIGSEFCFFFGPGNVITPSVTRPLAGLISNLFYAKSNDFDVLANTSGYVDGIVALEEPAIDDDDRASCEAFNYNPVIYLTNAYTIYGNKSGLKEQRAEQQVHGSELLAFVKSTLYNLAATEAFKKGNYDDLLKVETECKDFMNGLALLSAIEPNPVVICDASNNTLETKKAKIRMVHIEYIQVDALEKTIFDLNIE